MGLSHAFLWPVYSVMLELEEDTKTVVCLLVYLSERTSVCVDVGRQPQLIG